MKIRREREREEEEKGMLRGKVIEWGMRDLDNTSGMAETMASDIVSEDQVISRRRFSISLFLTLHCLSVSRSLCL